MGSSNHIWGVSVYSHQIKQFINFRKIKIIRFFSPLNSDLIRTTSVGFHEPLQFEIYVIRTSTIRDPLNNITQGSINEEDKCGFREPTAKGRKKEISIHWETDYFNQSTMEKIMQKLMEQLQKLRFLRKFYFTKLLYVPYACCTMETAPPNKQMWKLNPRRYSSKTENFLTNFQIEI